MKSRSNIIAGIVLLITVAIGIYVLVGVWNGEIQVTGYDPEDTINPAMFPEAAAAQAVQRNVENQQKLLEAVLEQNRLLQESIQNPRQ
jgi:hypothetical protein